MRAPAVIKADPIGNDAVGLRQGFKVVAARVLCFERADDRSARDCVARRFSPYLCASATSGIARRTSARNLMALTVHRQRCPAILASPDAARCCGERSSAREAAMVSLRMISGNGAVLRLSIQPSISSSVYMLFWRPQRNASIWAGFRGALQLVRNRLRKTGRGHVRRALRLRMQDFVAFRLAKFQCRGEALSYYCIV